MDGLRERFRLGDDAKTPHQPRNKKAGASHRGIERDSQKQITKSLLFIERDTKCAH